MSRLTRRLTATLLWIAIALLPVRGLAAAMMPALMPAASPHAAMVVEVPEQMPCHGAMADAAAAEVHAEPAAAPVGDCPTCSLCALCHASFAQAAPVSLELPTLPSAPPATAAPSALEPRAPDGLFRPPRTHLA